MYGTSILMWAAWMCLSVSYPPSSTISLSLMLRSSSGSHLLSSSSSSSSSELITIVATRCFFRFGCPLLSLFGEEDLAVLLQLCPPWHFEPQALPFCLQTHRLFWHPDLQLQQLDWNSFRGLRSWAASRKLKTLSFCQPSTCRESSPE